MNINKITDYQLTEAVQSTTTIDELLKLAEKHAKSLGFDYFCYGHRAHTPFAVAKLYLRNNYPGSWQKMYVENKFFDQDPTVLHATKTTAPLIWSDKNLNISNKFYEGAKSFGIQYGWSQATRNTSGLSMITLARASEPISNGELKEHMSDLLWFTQILNSALDKYVTAPQMEKPDIFLTSREAEVLRWTADGKTSYEISVILGIAERTVNFHLNNVMSKLDSHNKISATVKAIMLSLI